MGYSPKNVKRRRHHRNMVVRATVMLAHPDTRLLMTRLLDSRADPYCNFATRNFATSKPGTRRAWWMTIANVNMQLFFTEAAAFNKLAGIHGLLA